MTRIVTYMHRPKRPPRKKPQAAAIAAAVVTAASRKQAKRAKRTAEPDDGREVSPEIKAFFARMIRPPLAREE
jgi:hypothetical protein